MTIKLSDLPKGTITATPKSVLKKLGVKIIGRPSKI